MPFRKRNSRCQSALILGGVILFLSLNTGVYGLSIKAPKWKELVQQSDWVIRATVLQNKQSTLKNKFPVIQTTFQTHTQYKGKPLLRFTLQLLGGASGKYKIVANTMPRFTEKSQVILFLRASKHTSYPILVGLYYGVFDLDTSTKPPLIKHRGGKQPPQTLREFESLLKRSLASTNPNLTTIQKSSSPSSTSKK